MKPEIYVINSPLFPDQQDFKNFDVWCEWHDLKENLYLKSLFSSQKEFELKCLEPYEQGKETYYPIVVSNELPERFFLYVQVTVKIPESIELKGYVAIYEHNIVSLTIWLKDTPDDEVTFYRADRLAAEEDNQLSVSLLSKKCDIEPFSELIFSSVYILANGVKVKGSFNVNVT